MNVWENIKTTFRRGDALVKLIYVNAGVFLALKVAVIVLKLFNLPGLPLYSWLAMPADPAALLHRPWTLLTYMFLHEGFFHLFFNMLCLYWFGKLFLTVYSERHLVGLYLVGGLVAGAFYAVAFNLFPYYEPLVHASILMGASGSIMAITVATAFRLPNMEIRLFLVGGVKLKYVALAAIAVSFFGITSHNGGGELAHLGGALTGYLFELLMRRGTDITAWVNRAIDWVVNAFKPKRMKVRPGKAGTRRKMTDAEYNQDKARRMAEIDRILDKIKQSGYDSLSAEEKRRLFDQGRR